MRETISPVSNDRYYFVYCIHSKYMEVYEFFNSVSCSPLIYYARSHEITNMFLKSASFAIFPLFCNISSLSYQFQNVTV